MATWMGRLAPRLLSPAMSPCCSLCWLHQGSSHVRCGSTSAEGVGPQYVPRRAALYVPGNDSKKLAKIPALNADCAVMDCEDGVALNRKDEARQTICQMLDQLDFGRTEPVVRVNSVNSGLAEDDLRVTLAAQRVPPTIMVPKVEEVQHMNWIDQQVTTILRDRGHGTKVNAIVFVESAMGMLNLRDVCTRGKELSESNESLLNLDGIVFGSDDFCADVGATRTTDARELIYARQHVVMVAKAFRLQAIDLVHIDFKDTEGLREQSLEGARMGFTGKQVIHPAQVPIVQAAFTPSPEKIEWATELIKAFNEHQKSGKGAFTYRGSMIDMPLLRQAKNIVQMVESTQSTKS